MFSAHYIDNAAGGAALSIGAYLATGIEQVPEWLREFGLPVVMLAGAIFALVFLYKELKAERQARIDDRDEFVKLMREDASKGEAGRAELLAATKEQTSEFRALRRELTRNQP